MTKMKRDTYRTGFADGWVHARRELKHREHDLDDDDLEEELDDDLEDEDEDEDEDDGE